MSTRYDVALGNFKRAFLRMVKQLSEKLDRATVKTKLFATTSITLENNTIHRCNLLNGVNKLIINYPEGDFISTVLFSTATSGKIEIIFPEDKTSFVGVERLEFFPAENWELNIHNGRVVGARVHTEW